MRFDTGLLVHPDGVVTVKKGTYSDDANGGYTVGESTVGTRHCRIRPLKTEEIFEAQQVDEQITHEVTMRYDSTLAALKGRETWIEQGDRRFEIVGSKIDVMEGHRLIRFQCRERQ